MSERLCLLTVHAHPDDEASKGAGTVAKYHDAGVRTVLVTCTGGEEGELAESAKVIGYDEVVLLGYRDSGMPDSEANKRSDNFSNTPVEESTGRLVEVIRRERPQVVVTYNDDQRGYPHPDHLRVHDISVAAFAASGDPDAYPDLGEPWAPSKLYYTVWSRRRIEAMHEKMLELGVESPFTEEWFKRPSQDNRITTTIDVTGYYDVRKGALLAHATQVDPDSPFWFGLPDEVMRSLHPYEEYVLADSRVPTHLPEDDLFAGCR
jgi:mycothiol S-conjugate amidase